MNSVSTTNISGTDQGTDHDFDRPSGTGAFCIATQVLRAWLLSACPSGTKSHSPIEGPRIKLAVMGLKPWAKRRAESCSPLRGRPFGRHIRPIPGAQPVESLGSYSHFGFGQV